MNLPNVPAPSRTWPSISDSTAERLRAELWPLSAKRLSAGLVWESKNPLCKQMAEKSPVLFVRGCHCSHQRLLLLLEHRVVARLNSPELSPDHYCKLLPDRVCCCSKELLPETALFQGLPAEVTATAAVTLLPDRCAIA